MTMKDKLETYSRIYAEIDLDAIRYNIESLYQNLNPGTKMLGVIKADGYGHGSVPIAELLEPLPYMFGFATATFEEAEILIRNGIKKPILILGYTFPYCYEEIIRHEIRTTVFRTDMVKTLSDTAQKLGKKAIVHIKVDTGMSRIGIRADEEGLSFVREVMALPGIMVEGIFTHFAKADMTDKQDTIVQLERFRDFVQKIEKETGVRIPVQHCSNSAAMIRMPEANMDMVRPGIAMYGLWPSDEVERNLVSLKPALSLRSHIVYIKEMKAGCGISYGGTHISSDGMRVATVPIGYSDGYPRSLSDKGYVLIHGKRAAVLGRVCMDQMMVDVTDIPESEVGDRVTLLGSDGQEQITAEFLGDLSGRFNYELVCAINKRVPRVYLKGKEIIGTKDYYDDFEYLQKKGQ